MKKYITFFLFFLSNFIGFSQANQNGEANKIFPLSPQAGILGQYGELPVDLSTGKIGYTIPIYTIKVNDFEYPIQLSYNYNGLRPDDIPGNVGYGWSINTSGYISNNIRGLSDLSAKGYSKNAKNYILPFLNKEWDFLPPFEREKKVSDFFYNVNIGQIDTEPDRFIVNSGKMNFSFLLDENRVPFSYPYSNNKVELSFDFGEPQFKIIDDSGNKYSFTKLEYSESQLNNYFVDSKISAFNLTQITTKNNSFINFVYSTKYRNTPFFINNKRILTNGNTKSMPAGVRPENKLISGNSFTIYNEIKEIFFENGKVEFKYNTQIESEDSRLDFITIYDKQENIIDKYNFIYSKDKINQNK
jgi:hypothetical protein